MFIIDKGRYLSVTSVTFHAILRGEPERLAGKWAKFDKVDIQKHNLHVN